MKCRLAIAIPFLLIFLQASADDLHDRFDRVVKQLQSDNATERDRGSEELENIAKEAPDLVRPLAEDKDPEVKGRARELLKRLHLLADSPSERRAMDILDQLSVAKGKERESLIDEFLALGEPAGRLLAEELENCALEPVEQAIAVGEEGRAEALIATARNGGRVGLWVGAFETVGRNDFIGRRACFPWHSEDTQTEDPFRNDRIKPTLAQWLLTATRIPTGATARIIRVDSKYLLWHVAIQLSQRLISIKKATGNPCSVTVEAEIGGVKVKALGDCFPQFPVARGIALQEQDSLAFAAKVVGKGRRAGLEIRAIQDSARVMTEPDLDNFWFVAVNKAGAVLAFGPMGRETLDKQSWTAGERMTVLLEQDIPEGTARLWLGYDFGDAPGQSVVPAPLEVSEPEPRADPK